MVTKRTLLKQETIEVGGRTYYPRMPPSEQQVVLNVTRRLVHRTRADSAEVHITEEDLRAFATVYPRLYQLPATNRERLEGWRDAHPEEVRTWDLDGFFNTVDQDRGRIIRPAGWPREPIPALGITRDATASANDYRQQQQQPCLPASAVLIPSKSKGSTENKKSENTGQESAKRPQPPGSTQNSAGELVAALKSARRLTAQLEKVSARTDVDDPNKEILTDLAAEMNSHLVRASQATHTLVRQLDGWKALAHTAAGLDGGPKKRVHQDDDGQADTNHRRLKTRRAQTVAEAKVNMSSVITDDVRSAKQKQAQRMASENPHHRQPPLHIGSGHQPAEPSGIATRDYAVLDNNGAKKGKSHYAENFQPGPNQDPFHDPSAREPSRMGTDSASYPLHPAFLKELQSHYNAKRPPAQQANWDLRPGVDECGYSADGISSRPPVSAPQFTAAQQSGRMLYHRMSSPGFKADNRHREQDESHAPPRAVSPGHDALGNPRLRKARTVDNTPDDGVGNKGYLDEQNKTDHPIARPSEAANTRHAGTARSRSGVIIPNDPEDSDGTDTVCSTIGATINTQGNRSFYFLSPNDDVAQTPTP